MMEPEVSIDQYRDQGTMDQVKCIAAGIFARWGVNFATARRAGGWSNATWLAGGLALRIAVKPGNENIRRDARLAALLPQAVGYPTILETGVTDGYEWMLSKEIPGRCLGEAWSDLDWDARITAIRQLWEMARAVHGVDTAAAATIARDRAWYNSNDAGEAEAGLARLVGDGILMAQQAVVLRSALARFWAALPGTVCVLNHGDLTFDNCIWDGGRVVSLLDFEFAVIAPAELDLNLLVKHAFQPQKEEETLSKADYTGQQRLRKVVAELAQPVIAHPRGSDLLTGYAILLELWQLQNWLAHPDGEGPMEGWDPYRRLCSLADGRGGYLAPILLIG